MDFIGVRLPVAAVEPAEGEVVRRSQQRLDALHFGQPRLLLLVLEVRRRRPGYEVAGVAGRDQPGGAVVRVGGVGRGPVIPVRPRRLPDEKVVQPHPAVLRLRIDRRQPGVGLGGVEEAQSPGRPGAAGRRRPRSAPSAPCRRPRRRCGPGPGSRGRPRRRPCRCRSATPARRCAATGRSPACRPRRPCPARPRRGAPCWNASALARPAASASAFWAAASAVSRLSARLIFRSLRSRFIRTSASISGTDSRSSSVPQVVLQFRPLLVLVAARGLELRAQRLHPGVHRVGRRGQGGRLRGVGLFKLVAQVVDLRPQFRQPPLIVRVQQPPAEPLRVPGQLRQRLVPSVNCLAHDRAQSRTAL